MKKIIYFMLILVLFSCNSEKKPMLIGEIQLEGDFIPDTFFISIDEAEEFPDTLIKINSKKFELKLENKAYKISVAANGYQPVWKLFISNDNNNKHVKIKLAPMFVPDTISRVCFTSPEVVGRTGNWCEAMIEKEGKWYLPDNIQVEKGDHYKLKINKDIPLVTDLSNPNYELYFRWKTTESVYSGGEIVFNSELYPKENDVKIKKSLISFENDSISDEYNVIYKELQNWVKLVDVNYSQIIRDVNQFKSNNRVNEQLLKYESLENMIDSIGEAHDSIFTQLILLYKISFLSNISPYFYEVDSSSYTEKKHLDHIRKLISDLDTYNPKSLFKFNFFFLDRLSLLTKIEKNAPIIWDKLDAKGSSTTKRMEHYAKVLNPERFAILYWYWISDLPDSDKIQQYNTFLDKFPDFESTKGPKIEETIKRKIAELNQKSGDKAPEFSLKNQYGDTIKLSDFKRKYVLIDFWGTYCSGCVESIKELTELYDKNKFNNLEILSICIDSEERWQKFSEKHNLKYINCIGNDKVKDDYGITLYPRLFLIGKNGKFISTNLDWKNLEVELEKYIEL